MFKLIPKLIKKIKNKSKHYQGYNSKSLKLRSQDPFRYKVYLIYRKISLKRSYIFFMWSSKEPVLGSKKSYFISIDGIYHVFVCALLIR